jgi:hypothetical protein
VPSVSRYVVPFVAGVAVGAAVHKYWPQIQKAAGPRVGRGLSRASGLMDRARFWEQSEKFSDLIAEIREEDEAAARSTSESPPAF